MLREKLRALVAEWREEEKEERIQGSLMIAATLRACSKEVAALLAESEPSRVLGIDEWHICSTCGGQNYGWLRDGYAKCECHCETKVKLPLGHEFVPCEVAGRMFGQCSRMGVGACMWGEGQDGNPPTRYESLCHHPGCGQTRSAHEPK